jgi:hypothetical protein
MFGATMNCSSASRFRALGELMPHYRIYTVDIDGYISGPPSVVTCGDDDEATRRAKDLLNGSDVELWDGARFVGRIRSTED